MPFQVSGGQKKRSYISASLISDATSVKKEIKLDSFAPLELTIRVKYETKFLGEHGSQSKPTRSKVHGEKRDEVTVE